MAQAPLQSLLTPGGGGGGGLLNQVLYGEAPRRGPNPYPFTYHFWEKRNPFRIPFVENFTPFIYLRSEFY